MGLRPSIFTPKASGDKGVIVKRKLAIIGGSTLICAIAGFSYYAFVGCKSGTCPITSSPYISVIVGAVFGAAVGSTLSDRKEEKDADL